MAVLAAGALEVSSRAHLEASLGVGTFGLEVLALWLLGVSAGAVLGRLRRGFGLLLAAVLVLAVANRMRLDQLRSPLVPSDFLFLRDPLGLLGVLDARAVALALLGVGVLVASGVLLGRRAAFPRGTPVAGEAGYAMWRRARWLGVVALVLFGVVAAGFNREGNPLRRMYDAAGASWMPWSQTATYQANGFVGGFLYNLPTVAMVEPDGYSQDAVTAAARRWATESEPAAARGDRNVVVVLSESFADPRTVPSARLGEEVLPTVERLQRRGPHGDVWGSYGTGTSAMEFQVLTGQSTGLLEPQISSPYQQFVAGKGDYASAPRWFGERGYRTVALHPFLGQMYRREQVYDAFGFDTFETLDDIDPDLVPDNGYVPDTVPFDQVVNEVRASDQPVFAHVVTMQNHVPHDEEKDPVQVRGLEQGDAEAVGKWARGVQRSDAALGDFLADLRATGEDVVVVYFGDHHPGIYSEAVIAEGAGFHRRSPFLVWSTTAGTDDALEAADMGLQGAPSLLGTALRATGEPVPGMLRLAGEVAQRIGVPTAGGVVDAAGELVVPEDLEEDEQRLLNDMRLLQYDLSVGRGWSRELVW